MSKKHPAQGKTILVAEDFEDTRELISTWLRMNGYDLLEVADGGEAVELARRECPDLILMDLSLPTLDGISATRQIRKIKEICDVPIIACSAHDTREWSDKALTARCTDFVSKPVDFDALEKVIDCHLAKART
jgi:CheY-like chemotaxis protein